MVVLSERPIHQLRSQGRRRHTSTNAVRSPLGGCERAGAMAKLAVVSACSACRTPSRSCPTFGVSGSLVRVTRVRDERRRSNCAVSVPTGRTSAARYRKSTVGAVCGKGRGQREDGDRRADACSALEIGAGTRPRLWSRSAGTELGRARRPCRPEGRPTEALVHQRL